MPSEEELTKTLLEKYENRRIHKQEVEASYNNYGERGYVDLYEVKTDQNEDKLDHVHLYEIKANLQNFKPSEIVRQFTRMRRNFFGKGARDYPRNYGGRDPSVTYELTIYPTKENLDYLKQYKSIIRNIREKFEDSIVVFRCPCHGNILHVFTFAMDVGDDQWRDYVLERYSDSNCFSELKEAVTCVE